MGIASIRVEAWTRDERGAGTDGRIECTIGFAGRAGFGVLTFDTTADEPNGNWTVRVDYRRHDDGAVFFTHTYTVLDNQLRW